MLWAGRAWRTRILLTLGLCALQARADRPVIQTVALSGAPAPDAGGATYQFIVDANTLAPRMNDLGELAFLGGLSGQGVNSDNSLAAWLGTPSNLSLIVQQGTAVSDGSKPTTVGVTDLNDSGHFVMYTFVRPPGSTTQVSAMIDGVAGNVSMLARSGSPVPGTSLNYNVVSGSGTQINKAGQILFMSSKDNGTEASLFRAGGGAEAKIIAYQGQVPPGTEGRALVSFQSDSFHLTASGQTTFVATLDNTPTRSGLFLATPEKITTIAVTTQSTPGILGDIFQTPDPNVDVNAAGEVAFSAVTGANSAGVWKYNPQTGLKVLLRKNDLASLPGTHWQSFQGPKIDSLGHLAVYASTDTGIQGIWGGRANDMKLLFRHGAQAEGIPAGINYSASGNWQQDLNERGILVVVGNLSNGKKGVWAADLQTGAVELVFQTGEPFDVGGGDLRLIRGFNLFKDSFLNDANQFAFTATFTDGTTGAFVASVPEPSSAWLLLIAGRVTRRGVRRRLL